MQQTMREQEKKDIKKYVKTENSKNYAKAKTIQLAMRKRSKIIIQICNGKEHTNNYATATR